MNIAVKALGTGCSNCRRLYSEVQTAIARFSLPVTLTKVDDAGEIAKYKILALPGLIIDEELKSAGRVPNSTEIMSWLARASMK